MRRNYYQKKIRNFLWTVGSLCLIYLATTSLTHNWQMDYIRTDARTKLSQAYQYEKAQAIIARADLNRAHAIAEANRIIFASIQPNQQYISQVIVNHFTPYTQGF